MMPADICTTVATVGARGACPHTHGPIVWRARAARPYGSAVHGT